MSYIPPHFTHSTIDLNIKQLFLENDNFKNYIQIYNYLENEFLKLFHVWIKNMNLTFSITR